MWKMNFEMQQMFEQWRCFIILLGKKSQSGLRRPHWAKRILQAHSRVSAANLFYVCGNSNLHTFLAQLRISFVFLSNQDARDQDFPLPFLFINHFLWGWTFFAMKTDPVLCVLFTSVSQKERINLQAESFATVNRRLWKLLEAFYASAIRFIFFSK